MSDRIELVEGDRGFRQMVCDAFDEGRRHVEAGCGDVVRRAAVGAQMLDKAGDVVGVAKADEEWQLAAGCSIERFELLRVAIGPAKLLLEPKAERAW